MTNNNLLKLEELLDPLYEILPSAVRLVNVNREEDICYAEVEIRNVEIDQFFVEFSPCVIKYEIDPNENTVNVVKTIEISEILNTQNERSSSISAYNEIYPKVERMLEDDIQTVAEVYRKLLVKE